MLWGTARFLAEASVGVPGETWPTGGLDGLADAAGYDWCRSFRPGNCLVSADFVHLGDTCFIVTAGGPESSAKVNSSPNRTFHIWMIVKCSKLRHRVRPGGAARIARLQGIWFSSILAS